MQASPDKDVMLRRTSSPFTWSVLLGMELLGRLWVLVEAALTQALPDARSGPQDSGDRIDAVQRFTV
jgi:hypothetical protein